MLHVDQKHRLLPIHASRQAYYRSYRAQASLLTLPYQIQYRHSRQK